MTPELEEPPTRRALQRQLLLAGGLVVAFAVLVLGARRVGVSLETIERGLFVVGGLAAVAVFRAGRSLWRVQRDGLGGVVPAPPDPLAAAPRSELDEHDRFLVAERFRWFGDRYELSVLAPDGRSPGELIAVVDREAFTARERLDARKPDALTVGYGDAGRWESDRVFLVTAQQVLDVGGRYRVEAPGGARIGELRKVFATSLLRATWEVWDGAGTLVATAQERSLAVALLRRTIDLIPVLGEILGLLPIPYHFDVRAAPSGERIAAFTRLRAVRDRYALTIDGDPGRVLDRRLALALAVSLDALQGR